MVLAYTTEMEMTDFDHVEDQKIRSLLLGDVSEDAICYALTQSRDALMSDQFNPDVSYKTLAIREEAIDDAEFCWNDEGDLDGTLAGLQRFWRN
jgi:alpha-galactosidase/6-phospho-beta-glucosidase family protein